MAKMKFYNVDVPPTSASSAGTYLVENTEDDTLIDISVVSRNGTVKKQNTNDAAIAQLERDINNFFAHTDNLFDKSAIVFGLYGTDGITFQSSNLYVCSDFMPVSAGMNYKRVNGDNYYVYAYDSNQNPVQVSGINVFWSGNFESVTIPANVSFVRVLLAPAHSELFMFTQQGVDTSSYIPYPANVLKKEVLPEIENDDLKPIKFTTRERNTFIGAYNYVLDNLFLAKPTSRIVFVTHFTQDSSGKNLYKLLIDAQKAIAKYRKAKLINLSDNLNWVSRDGNDIVGQRIQNGGVREGIHPAYDYDENIGRSNNIDMIAAYCAEELKGMFLDWTGKKIAWYGTSIPDGVPYAGIHNCQYPLLVADKLGCVCTNYSKSASVIRKTKYDFSDLANTSAHDQFSNDEEEYQAGHVTYLNSMINLIGTEQEPDLFVFDHGFNDFYLDQSDFLLIDFASAE
jgi:hypothetical protein